MKFEKIYINKTHFFSHSIIEEGKYVFFERIFHMKKSNFIGSLSCDQPVGYDMKVSLPKHRNDRRTENERAKSVQQQKADRQKPEQKI